MTESAARELASDILPEALDHHTLAEERWRLEKALLSSRLVEMPSVEALAEFMEKRDKAVGFSYFYWDDAQAIVNFLKGEMK